MDASFTEKLNMTKAGKVITEFLQFKNFTSSRKKILNYQNFKLINIFQ